MHISFRQAKGNNHRRSIMLDKNDQVIARLGKLDKLREMGLEPYPHHFKRSHDSESLKANKESLLKSEEKISFVSDT